MPAAKADGEKDAMRDILDKLETPAVRWALVCIGVLILVRLRLILFACALPVIAYWHYSNRSEEPAEASQDAGDDEQQPQGQERGEDDEEFDNDDDFGGRPGRTGADEEVYDKSFWAADGQDKNRSDPSRGDDDGAPKKKENTWDDDPSGGPVDDFLPKAGKSNMDDIFDSFSSLPPLGGDDMFSNDFLSQSFGGDFGRGGSKGKGKGKKGDKGGFRDGGEKGDKGPREPNPKQVFVAGVGDLGEDEIRGFFEEVGEVDRLKLLTNEDGNSKGVCFVTFGTIEQAQEALKMHGADLNGRNITVRLAHGGNKGKGEGKDGDKGGGKRDFGGGNRDRAPMDFGPSERFGAAFGDDRGERSDRPKGKGKGKSGGRNERSELDEILEEACNDQEGPVKPADFDFAARKILSELRNRDRSDNTEQFREAMDMVMKYTCQKDRSSVRKWPAYVFTLLQKFDPRLWEEITARDQARRQEKGAGRDRPPREITRDRDDDRPRGGDDDGRDRD